MTEAEQAFTEMRKVWRERDVPMLKEGRDPFAICTVSMQTVIGVVALEYGVTWERLMGRSRAVRNCEPRQVAMHLCRKLTGKSLPRIARVFDRDHSTVLSNVRAIEARLERDDEFFAKVAEIARKCRIEARAWA